MAQIEQWMRDAAEFSAQEIVDASIKVAEELKSRNKVDVGMFGWIGSEPIKKIIVSQIAAHAPAAEEGEPNKANREWLELAYECAKSTCDEIGKMVGIDINDTEHFTGDMLVEAVRTMHVRLQKIRDIAESHKDEFADKPSDFAHIYDLADSFETAFIGERDKDASTLLASARLHNHKLREALRDKDKQIIKFEAHSAHVRELVKAAREIESSVEKSSRWASITKGGGWYYKINESLVNSLRAALSHFEKGV